MAIHAERAPDPDESTAGLPWLLQIAESGPALPQTTHCSRSLGPPILLASPTKRLRAAAFASPASTRKRFADYLEADCFCALAHFHSSSLAIASMATSSRLPASPSVPRLATSAVQNLSS